jgi:acylphosphatase
MKKSVRMIIMGSVQGVFFREFIREGAINLKVKGFTKNLPNGGVEVFLEGNIDSVDKMISLCKTGPRLAQVRDVAAREERFRGFKDFRILDA